MSEKMTKSQSYGVVKISEEVVGVIAGISASEIEGIVGLQPTLTGGITQVVTGKRNVTKGVKVTVGEQDAIIDMTVGIIYGYKIPETVEKAQKAVREQVETITGLKVSAVNITVSNIHLKEKETKEK